MKNICIFFIIFLLSITIANAQEIVDTLEQTTDVKEQKIRRNEIGLHAGFTTAFGLSYRHWFGREGIQLTGIGTISDDASYISYGVTVMHRYKTAEKYRLFAYVGNHLIETDDDVTHNVGIGSGISYGKAYVANLMIGYALYSNTDRAKFRPTIEGGLYYRF